MRKLLQIFLFSIIITCSAMGSVVFEFIYDDTQNQVDLNLLTTIKCNIEQAGKLVGEVLDHDANIKIKVKFSFSLNALATGSSEYHVTYTTFPFLIEENFIEADMPDAYVRSVVLNKIVNGDDLNEEIADGHITINIEKLVVFDFDDHVTFGKEDFIATIMHELTHALDFFSLLSKGLAKFRLGDYFFEKFTHNSFDTLLIDENGKRFTDKFKDSDQFLNTRFYFNGENAQEANGGKPVPLHIRDRSHIDTEAQREMCLIDASFSSTNTIVDHLMQAGGTAYFERLPRKWSKIERAILKDLGYRLKSDECKSEELLGLNDVLRTEELKEDDLLSILKSYIW